MKATETDYYGEQVVSLTKADLNNALNTLHLYKEIRDLELYGYTVRNDKLLRFVLKDKNDVEIRVPQVRIVDPRTGVGLDGEQAIIDFTIITFNHMGFFEDTPTNPVAQRVGLLRLTSDEKLAVLILREVIHATTRKAVSRPWFLTEDVARRGVPPMVGRILIDPAFSLVNLDKPECYGSHLVPLHDVSHTSVNDPNDKFRCSRVEPKSSFKVCSHVTSCRQE